MENDLKATSFVQLFCVSKSILERGDFHNELF